jgi:hypothetical protein
VQLLCCAASLSSSRGRASTPCTELGTLAEREKEEEEEEEEGAAEAEPACQLQERLQRP